MEPPNYPHFFLTHGENYWEVNHDTGYLFTHPELWMDRDHLFIRDVERDEPARMIGVTIFRAEITVEYCGVDFDDIANYMIENDFWTQHKPYVDGQDEIVFQQYKDKSVQRELGDLGDYFPDEWAS